MDLAFIFVETTSFLIMSDPGSPFVGEVLDYVHFFVKLDNPKYVYSPSCWSQLGRFKSESYRPRGVT